MAKAVSSCFGYYHNNNLYPFVPLFACKIRSKSDKKRSVVRKMLEHIIFSSSMKHLNSYKIPTPSQHGFRSKRSCKTQLISTKQGISQNLKSEKDQVDVIELDFAKTFDNVPFQRLLLKLNYYGIRGNNSNEFHPFFMRELNKS